MLFFLFVWIYFDRMIFDLSRTVQIELRCYFTSFFRTLSQVHRSKSISHSWSDCCKVRNFLCDVVSKEEQFSFECDQIVICFFEVAFLLFCSIIKFDYVFKNSFFCCFFRFVVFREQLHQFRFRSESSRSDHHSVLHNDLCMSVKISWSLSVELHSSRSRLRVARHIDRCFVYSSSNYCHDSKKTK